MSIIPARNSLWIQNHRASIKQEGSDDEESGDDAENVDTADKNAVVQSIWENGGSVIDHFDELFNLKGAVAADESIGQSILLMNKKADLEFPASPSASILLFHEVILFIKG